MECDKTTPGSSVIGAVVQVQVKDPVMSCMDTPLADISSSKSNEVSAENVSENVGKEAEDEKNNDTPMNENNTTQINQGCLETSNTDADKVTSAESGNKEDAVETQNDLQANGNEECTGGDITGADLTSGSPSIGNQVESQTPDVIQSESSKGLEELKTIDMNPDSAGEDLKSKESVVEKELECKESELQNESLDENKEFDPSNMNEIPNSKDSMINNSTVEIDSKTGDQDNAPSPIANESHALTQNEEYVKKKEDNTPASSLQSENETTDSHDKEDLSSSPSSPGDVDEPVPLSRKRGRKRKSIVYKSKPKTKPGLLPQGTPIKRSPGKRKLTIREILQISNHPEKSLESSVNFMQYQSEHSPRDMSILSLHGTAQSVPAIPILQAPILPNIAPLPTHSVSQSTSSDTSLDTDRLESSFSPQSDHSFSPEKGTRRRGQTIKSYKCLGCPYTSLIKTNIRRHVSHHISYKPYFCDTCKTVCTDRAVIVFHVKQKHGIFYDGFSYHAVPEVERLIDKYLDLCVVHVDKVEKLPPSGNLIRFKDCPLKSHEVFKDLMKNGDVLPTRANVLSLSLHCSDKTSVAAEERRKRGGKNISTLLAERDAARRDPNLTKEQTESTDQSLPESPIATEKDILPIYPDKSSVSYKDSSKTSNFASWQMYQKRMKQLSKLSFTEKRKRTRHLKCSNNRRLIPELLPMRTNITNLHRVEDEQDLNARDDFKRSDETRSKVPNIPTNTPVQQKPYTGKPRGRPRKYVRIEDNIDKNQIIDGIVEKTQKNTGDLLEKQVEVKRRGRKRKIPLESQGQEDVNKMNETQKNLLNDKSLNNEETEDANKSVVSGSPPNKRRRGVSPSLDQLTTRRRSTPVKKWGPGGVLLCEEDTSEYDSMKDQDMSHFVEKRTMKKPTVREYYKKKYNKWQQKKLEPKNKQIQCPYCPQEFSSFNGMRRHAFWKHRMCKFQCTECDYWTTFRPDATVHFKAVHPGKTLKLERNFSVPGVGVDNQHPAKHSKPTKTVVPKSEPKTDIETVSNSSMAGMATCPHCSFNSTVRGVGLHLLAAHNVCQYFCSKCNYGSTSKFGIQVHVHKKHGKLSNVAVKKRLLWIKPDHCDDPPKEETASKNIANVSTKSPRKLESDFAEKSPKQNADDEMGKCYCCDYVSTIRGVGAHLVHKHNLFSWQCCVCNYKSFSKMKVQNHVLAKHPEAKSTAIRKRYIQVKPMSKTESQDISEVAASPTFSLKKQGSKLLKYNVMKSLQMPKDKEKIQQLLAKRGRPRKHAVDPGVTDTDKGTSYTLRPKKIELLQVGFSCVYCHYAAPLRHQLHLHCYDKHTNFPACLMKFTCDTQIKVRKGKFHTRSKTVDKQNMTNFANVPKIFQHSPANIEKISKTYSEGSQYSADKMDTLKTDCKMTNSSEAPGEAALYKPGADAKDIVPCEMTPSGFRQGKDKKLGKFTNPLKPLIGQLSSCHVQVDDAFQCSLDEIDNVLSSFGVRTLNMDMLSRQQFSNFIGKFGNYLEQV